MFQSCLSFSHSVQRREGCACTGSRSTSVQSLDGSVCRGPCVAPLTCVTAAGLRASNSRNTSVWPELIRLGTRRVITATRSIMVMEYYFYLWAGTCTSHIERWRALSSRYSLLLGCWPFGFLITLILKTGVQHRSRFYWDTAIPVRYGTERNKVVYFSENQ